MLEISSLSFKKLSLSKSIQKALKRRLAVKVSTPHWHSVLSDEICRIIDSNSRNLWHTAPWKDVRVGHIYKRCRKGDISNFLSVLSTLGLLIFFPNLQLSCINKYNCVVYFGVTWMCAFTWIWPWIALKEVKLHGNKIAGGRSLCNSAWAPWVPPEEMQSESTIPAA